MTDYQPLPGDQLAKNGLTLHVERVFPEQVAFYFTTVLRPPSDHAVISREEFDRKAQASFRNGAALVRDGVVLWPTPAPQPEPTPMNAETETTLSGSHNLHARLSPSDSKRWSNCTASIAFQEANAHRIPPDRSAYSDEGTEAHDWATKILTGTIAPIDIPASFRDPVCTYTDHCLSLVPDAVLTHLDDCLSEADLGFDAPERALFVEEQIPLYYQPEQTGTADFIALHAVAGTVDRIYVRDYKHGAGVLVSTQENTQLAIYAFSVVQRLRGAYQFPDSTPVDIAIVQPRHREAEGVKPWIITLADLETFCKDIEYRAIQARTAAERVREKIGSPGRDVGCDEIKEAAPGSVFAPSEGDEGACRWCKCKAFCDKRIAALSEGMDIPSMDAVDMLAAMPELSKAESKLPVEERIALVSEVLGAQGRIITDEYLVNLVGRAKGIRALLDDAEEYLESRLLAGEEIEGVKLVDGREGNRDWANPDEAETFLKNQGLKMEERFDFKLKSPAKIEQLLATKLKSTTRTKNRFEQLITRSPAKKKIAVTADKRDAVAPVIASMPDVQAIEDFEV